jgi:hypothetical protein
MVMSKLTLVGFVFLLLSGCGSISNQYVLNYSDEFKNFIVKQELKSLEKIEPFILKGYLVLDDQHIAITGVNAKTFLLTTSKTCKNMYQAKKVNLLTNDKNTVQVHLDKVTRVGAEYEPCSITNIYSINKVQYDELVHLNNEIRKSSKLTISHFPHSV